MIVVKPRYRIILHPGEHEPIAVGGVGLRHDVAERIVDDLVEDGRGRRRSRQPSRPGREVPRRVAAGVGAGQDLVDRQAVEVAHLQRCPSS